MRPAGAEIVTVVHSKIASPGGKLSPKVTDEECGREFVGLQNVTDLLRIYSLETIVPNRSDTLIIKSDYHPHSSSDPPVGGPPSPRGKGMRLAALVIRPTY